MTPPSASRTPPRRMTMGRRSYLPRNDMEDVPVLGIAARCDAVGFLLLEHLQLEAVEQGQVPRRGSTKVMPGRPTQLSRGPYHWPLKRPPGGRASRMRVPYGAKCLRLAKRHGEARIHQAEADRQRHLLKSRHDRRDVAAGRQAGAPAVAAAPRARRRRRRRFQPRRSISTTSRPSPQPRSMASASAAARRSGRARRAACGAAAGRAASRSRRPSRLICLPSCARLIRPALVACHSV